MLKNIERPRRVWSLHRDLGVELNYDELSIQWLDGYINRIRTQVKRESYPGLAAALGAYAGQTIIATYGGCWHYFKQDDWGIRFADGNGAFPITKLHKQLEDGKSDSILSFFTRVPKLRDHVNCQRTELPLGKGWKPDQKSNRHTKTLLPRNSRWQRLKSFEIERLLEERQRAQEHINRGLGNLDCG